jgi:enamine deaminase RidA (YjgF/YER057c/UK114 family)
MERLKAVTGDFTPVQGDCGDEYRVPPFLTASGDLSHHLTSFPAPFDVITGDDGVGRIDSGTVWERDAGYSRAIRVGDRVLISGTTATHGSQLIGGDDAEAQAEFIFDKIEAALVSFGATMEDVVRTRIFVSDLAHWEGAARAHGHRFAHSRPANTLVQAGLVGAGYLVEIEAEAVHVP